MFKYCSVSILPLRAEPKDSSEMVSQLVFGETVEHLDQQNQWVQLKCRKDGYTGWVDGKCLSELTELQMIDWEKTQIPMLNPVNTLNSSDGLVILTSGAFVSKNNTSFQIGSDAFELNHDCSPLPDFLSIAKHFLNSPYLWGGKTMFGIDCSGLVQVIYRFVGIELQRDASLQEKEGTIVPFNEKKLGDLAFFSNSSGRITHVGIVLENQQILHAHGKVRIDELHEKGIYNNQKKYYSHQLSTLKRFF